MHENVAQKSHTAQKYTSMFFDKTQRNPMCTSDLGQGVAARAW